ncbi:MAG TPA: DUF1800 domain-containing protein [Burkholderiales bacterium]|nr:DUF1800 domain-containing protein [Burkholderiales bacterium]
MKWAVALALALPLAAHAAAMGPDEARHLLNRTGFGAQPREIAEYAALSRSEAVERQLAGMTRAARTPPPDRVREAIVPPRQLRQAAPEERKSFQAQEIRRGFDLRTWWLEEMLQTRSPLTERMTLFWHNHFVSGQQKVRYTKLMYEQNVLLRRYAGGRFGELLHAVAKDPAMVIYLDSASNRKGKPNENFAREVMELFTLGEGHYTEADVREAARAFTGWSIDPDSGDFKWRPALHDEGTKTVLGRTGNFDGDAVLDILLARPSTAEFVVTKLWREFVSPEPDPAEVRRIAQKFQLSNYEIKVALRELLLSPAFWAPENRGALIKSPVDLVVGTMRALDFHVGDPLPLALVVAQLGQNLFSPPNVKGWPGGEAWINSSTLLARKGFAERIFRADEMPTVAMGELRRRANDADFARTKGFGRMGEEGRERFVRALYEIQFDPQRWLGQFPGAVSHGDMERALLARDPVTPVPTDLSAREVIKRIALDPSYQLK